MTFASLSSASSTISSKQSSLADFRLRSVGYAAWRRHEVSGLHRVAVPPGVLRVWLHPALHLDKVGKFVHNVDLVASKIPTSATESQAVVDASTTSAAAIT